MRASSARPDGTLFSARERETLTNYAKAALDWAYVDEDSDLYYQRMFNLAGDVVRLVVEVERLRQGLWDVAIRTGFDTDGDETPDHMTFPDIVELALREVERLRVKTAPSRPRGVRLVDPLKGANCGLCGATADNFRVSDELWAQVGLGPLQACFKCFRTAAWHVGLRPETAWSVSLDVRPEGANPSSVVPKGTL